MIDLETFYESLMGDVHNNGQASGAMAQESFFDLVCDQLIELGELVNKEYTYLEDTNPRRSFRIDGWNGEIDDSGEVVLIVQDFNQSANTLETLTKRTIESLQKKVSRFIQYSREAEWRANLEESHPATHLAGFLAENWAKIEKVRLVVLTNKALTERIQTIPETNIEGNRMTTTIWDARRLHKLEVDGSQGAPIEIDLLQEFGEGLLALEVPATSDNFEAFVCVVPGMMLAELYDAYSARLLEQNVRVFLQARGKVNQGIRDTIKSQPENFFAFNNGLTATAEDVRLEQTERGLEIVGVQNLQIVNGGQTTCSIHAAWMNRDVRPQLEHISVQMKLTKVKRDFVEDFVPKVSRYANSQNKVNEADFFSNHPFHKQIKDLSGTTLIPSQDGSAASSKWFYERARGQYQDERNKTKGIVERRVFENEYPKRCMFTKTDLSKYDMVTRLEPHTVCKGAQKNFLVWSNYITKEWSQKEANFNATYFKHLIAKAIIFKNTERLVSDAEWYDGGYRANIVAYTIAKLCQEVQNNNLVLDYDRIWQSQDITDDLSQELNRIGHAVYDHLLNPPRVGQNVGEWSKKKECWEVFQDRKIADVTQSSMHGYCIPKQQHQQRNKEAAEDQTVINEFSASADVLDLGNEFWTQVSSWGTQHGYLVHPRDKNIVLKASRGDLLDSKPATRALEILKDLRDKGFDQ